MTTLQQGGLAGIPCFIGSDEPDSWPALSEDVFELTEADEAFEVLDEGRPPPPPPVAKRRMISAATRDEPDLLALSAYARRPDSAIAVPQIPARPRNETRSVRGRGVLITWVVLLSCANVYLLWTRDAAVDHACPTTSSVGATEHGHASPHMQASSNIIVRSSTR